MIWRNDIVKTSRQHNFKTVETTHVQLTKPHTLFQCDHPMAMHLLIRSRWSLGLTDSWSTVSGRGMLTVITELVT